MPVVGRQDRSRGARVNDEHAHVAMPKLYGAAAYARPPVVPVEPVERPFDPDDLPLESERTREEQEYVQTIAAHPYGASASSEQAHGVGGGLLRGRAFRLRVPGRHHDGR
jgi:hypothetical protein